jgi:PleD family two-component response regulator
LIFADYLLPAFNAQSALRAYQESGLDVPFIVISGVIGEETAVHVVDLGASDYLLKENLLRLIAWWIASCGIAKFAVRTGCFGWKECKQVRMRVPRVLSSACTWKRSGGYLLAVRIRQTDKDLRHCWKRSRN